jgi:hypothetical protein
MCKGWLIPLMAIGLVGLPRGLGEPPEPAPAQPSWQLDFSFLDPQRISVEVPGQDEPTTFWYVVYTVTNRTGEDVGFFPSISLVTDMLEVVESGDGVHPRVYEAIAARHKGDYPFLAPPWKVTGPLMQGEANARSSVAVFRPLDPRASSFTIYVGGLSGEATRVLNPAHPTADRGEEQAPYFVLRKTLALRYELPGDPATRDRANAVRKDREWIMR